MTSENAGTSLCKKCGAKIYYRHRSYWRAIRFYELGFWEMLLFPFRRGYQSGYKLSEWSQWNPDGSRHKHAN